MRRLSLLSGAAVLLVVTGCGRAKTFDSVAMRGPMHTQRSTNVNALAAADASIALRGQQFAFIVGESTRRRNNLIAFLGSLRAVTPTPPESLVTADSPTTSALPPEYVCQRESHCTYGINTGNGYWGKWQFAPGTWTSGATQWNAAHPDQPIPTSVNEWGSVQPWMEDATAEMIWQSGAGCGHWAAC